MPHRILGVVTLVLTISIAAAAQPAPPNRPARDGLPAMEVVRMLDAYALVQAQDVLALTDEQYPQFVTRLKRLQETRRLNQRERLRIVAELRRLIGPPARQAAAGEGAAAPLDEGAVRDRLRALRELEDRAQAEMRKAYEALDEVLDVRQQARFRIFEEQLERRKLDLLMRARDRAARGRTGGS